MYTLSAFFVCIAVVLSAYVVECCTPTDAWNRCNIPGDLSKISSNAACGYSGCGGAALSSCSRNTNDNTVKGYFSTLDQIYALCAGHVNSPCSSTPCYNGGTCSVNGNAYRCSCPPNFFGVYCERAVGSSGLGASAPACFTTNATVVLESGRQISIQDASVGDRVLSFDNSGKLLFSEIVMWMDYVPQASVDLVQLITKTGKMFKATPYHLVLVGDSFTQMRNVKIGDELVLTDDEKGMHKEKVERISEISGGIGAYAPLTQEGTIVVDGIGASCYAYSHRLGEIAFAPMKLMSKLGIVSGKADGMHWYSKALVDWTETLGAMNWLQS